MYLSLDDIVRHIRDAQASGQQVKVGIAISGGGVRDAYSAGAVEALLRKFFSDPNRPIRPDVLRLRQSGLLSELEC
jgi:hypothetical protein